MDKGISVIIPVFNRPRLLQKAVDSVLAQDYRHFELIVVDDGSDEDVKRILPKDKRIFFLRQEHKGPAAARNTGIRAAQGKFIAFLDSDDAWREEKLKIQISEMRKHPSYPIAHTQEVWYKNGRLLSQKKKHAKYSGFIFEKCLPLCCVGISTAMIRKELFKKVGLFDESLPCCEDYDFWLRAAVNVPFLLIDQALTVKDGGRSDQVSSLFAQGMDKFRIRAMVKILDDGKNLSQTQRAQAIAELKKKCRIYGNGCLKHGRPQEGKTYLELPLRYA